MNRFPENKKFAFSIFDDTDNSTVKNIGPVYRLLRDLGFRTTKSVWPLAGAPGARFGGASLQDRGYLAFVHELHRDGFEIGLHNVRSGSAERRVVQGSDPAGQSDQRLLPDAVPDSAEPLARAPHVPRLSFCGYST